MSDLLKTPLYQCHVDANSKIVDFGGWALPANYGSQIIEHTTVRQNCGMFDVSHMRVTDVKGPDVIAFYEKLLANDIKKATTAPGKAIYSCMLNDAGGVIDDLIVYYINDQHCRMVTNAGTAEKDMLWFQKHATDFNIELLPQPDLAILAIQGPNAIKQLCASLTAKFDSLDANSSEQLIQLINSLDRFQGGFVEQQFIGRTGYTGEDGVECLLSPSFAIELWKQLIADGVQPCGLGARDTLRLEAGMALYGNDLDENHTPLDSNLKWTISMQGDRSFIGKEALETQALNKSNHHLIGLVLLDKGVLRSHQTIELNGETIGEITSGTFSPTTEKSIALARVKTSGDTTSDLAIGNTLQVAVRKKLLNVKIVKYPFVKNNKATF